jgi:hypothetical protein
VLGYIFTHFWSIEIRSKYAVENVTSSMMDRVAQSEICTCRVPKCSKLAKPCHVLDRQTVDQSVDDKEGGDELLIFF